MDKFCNICGNVIPQDSNVCPVCGTPVQGDQPKKKKSKLPLIIGIIALVLVICAVSFVAYTLLTGDDDKDSDSGSSDDKSVSDKDEDFSENTPDDVVEDYVNAMFIDFDAEALLELQHEKTIDYLGEQAGISNREDYIKTVEDSLLNPLKEGIREKNADVEWEITDHEQIGSATKKKIAGFFESEIGLEVTDYEKVFFTINLVSDGEIVEDGTENLEMTVVKIDGVWYMYLVEGLF